MQVQVQVQVLVARVRRSPSDVHVGRSSSVRDACCGECAQIPLEGALSAERMEILAKPRQCEWCEFQKRRHRRLGAGRDLLRVRVRRRGGDGWEG